MENVGIMLGVSGDVTSRFNSYMFKWDGRFSMGNLDYSSSGTGTMSDKRNYSFETRLSLDRDIKASKSVRITPFLGVGYRYLFDRSSGRTITTENWYMDGSQPECGFPVHRNLHTNA